MILTSKWRSEYIEIFASQVVKNLKAEEIEDQFANLERLEIRFLLENELLIYAC
jgi:hypothetical protein